MRGKGAGPAAGQRYPMKNGTCVKELFAKTSLLARMSMRGAGGPVQPLLSGLDPVRTLLDLSGESLILVRLPSGRLVDANETAYRLLGYSREELLARSLPDIFPSAETGKSCLILSADGSSP